MIEHTIRNEVTAFIEEEQGECGIDEIIEYLLERSGELHAELKTIAEDQMQIVISNLTSGEGQ